MINSIENYDQDRKPKQFMHPPTEDPVEGWKWSRIIGERLAVNPLVKFEKVNKSKNIKGKFNSSVKNPSGIQQKTAIIVEQMITHFLGNRNVSVI